MPLRGSARTDRPSSAASRSRAWRWAPRSRRWRSAYWFVQIVRGDYYFSLSENNRIRAVKITAPRGLRPRPQRRDPRRERAGLHPAPLPPRGPGPRGLDRLRGRSCWGCSREEVALPRRARPAGARVRPDPDRREPRHRRGGGGRGARRSSTRSSPSRSRSAGSTSTAAAAAHALGYLAEATPEQIKAAAGVTRWATGSARRASRAPTSACSPEPTASGASSSTRTAARSPRPTGSRPRPGRTSS